MKIEIGDPKKEKKIVLTVTVEVDLEIAVNKDILEHAIRNSWEEVKSWQEDGDDEWIDATEESSRIEFFKNYESEFYNWIETGGMIDFFKSKKNDQVEEMIAFPENNEEMMQNIKKAAINFIRDYDANSSHLVDFK
jgi:hypothetical protein